MTRKGVVGCGWRRACGVAAGAQDGWGWARGAVAGAGGRWQWVGRKRISAGRTAEVCEDVEPWAVERRAEERTGGDCV